MFFFFLFFFQAEDGIRDQPRSRGLGDVYKRQGDQVTMESNKIDDSGLDNPLYKEVQNAFDMDDDF